MSDIFGRNSFDLLQVNSDSNNLPLFIWIHSYRLRISLSWHFQYFVSFGINWFAELHSNAGWLVYYLKATASNDPLCYCTAVMLHFCVCIGGSSPQHLGGHRGSGGRTPVGSMSGAPGQKTPLKLKHFWFLDVQWKSQICSVLWNLEMQRNQLFVLFLPKNPG